MAAAVYLTVTQDEDHHHYVDQQHHRHDVYGHCTLSHHNQGGRSSSTIFTNILALHYIHGHLFSKLITCLLIAWAQASSLRFSICACQQELFSEAEKPKPIYSVPIHFFVTELLRQIKLRKVYEKLRYLIQQDGLFFSFGLTSMILILRFFYAAHANPGK